jgi:hypothetical protein
MDQMSYTLFHNTAFSEFCELKLQNNYFTFDTRIVSSHLGI